MLSDIANSSVFAAIDAGGKKNLTYAMSFRPYRRLHRQHRALVVDVDKMLYIVP